VRIDRGEHGASTARRVDQGAQPVAVDHDVVTLIAEDCGAVTDGDDASGVGQGAGDGIIGKGRVELFTYCTQLGPGGGEPAAAQATGQRQGQRRLSDPVEALDDDDAARLAAKRPTAPHKAIL